MIESNTLLKKEVHCNWVSSSVYDKPYRQTLITKFLLILFSALPLRPSGFAYRITSALAMLSVFLLFREAKAC